MIHPRSILRFFSWLPFVASCQSSEPKPWAAREFSNFFQRFCCVFAERSLNCSRNSASESFLRSVSWANWLWSCKACSDSRALFEPSLPASDSLPFLLLDSTGTRARLLLSSGLAAGFFINVMLEVAVGSIQILVQPNATARHPSTLHPIQSGLSNPRHPATTFVPKQAVHFFLI